MVQDYPAHSFAIEVQRTGRLPGAMTSSVLAYLECNEATMNRVLVTGGAGYIGSHVVLALIEHGFPVLVLDNLSTGTRNALLPKAIFVEGNVGDPELLSELFRRYSISAVMHFAASIIVPESIEDPLTYYGNNCSTTRNLLEAMREHGIKHLIFSSSASVYGMPALAKVSEETPTVPIHPYGRTKLICEWMIKDAAAVSPDSTHVILRYFNVAGTDMLGRLGQNSPQATHLVKAASLAALGERERFTVFGTDYPTPDGTCIRDFIHVSDLSDIHVLALEHLLKGGESSVFNCGYGRGYSVKEVVSAMREVAGDFTVVDGPRRPGDPAALVADTTRLRSVLGWSPRYDDLKAIVTSALDWERGLRPRSK